METRETKTKKGKILLAGSAVVLMAALIFASGWKGTVMAQDGGGKKQKQAKQDLGKMREFCAQNPQTCIQFRENLGQCLDNPAACLASQEFTSLCNQLPQGCERIKTLLTKCQEDPQRCKKIKERLTQRFQGAGADADGNAGQRGQRIKQFCQNNPEACEKLKAAKQWCKQNSQECQTRKQEMRDWCKSNAQSGSGGGPGACIKAYCQQFPDKCEFPSQN